MSKYFAKETWNNLNDLMEVCRECQAAAIVGLDLYAQHLYLAHLRDSSGDELDQLGFSVEDAGKELDRFERLGVEIAQKPYENATQVVFFANDPDGILY